MSAVLRRLASSATKALLTRSADADGHAVRLAGGRPASAVHPWIPAGAIRRSTRSRAVHPLVHQHIGVDAWILIIVLRATFLSSSATMGGAYAAVVLKPLVHSDDERLQLERCARRPRASRLWPCDIASLWTRGRAQRRGRGAPGDRPRHGEQMACQVLGPAPRRAAPGSAGIGDDDSRPLSVKTSKRPRRRRALVDAFHG